MSDDPNPVDGEASQSETVVVESTALEVASPQSIEEPAKLLRIASMTRSMLEEVRQATLDEDGRSRLRDIHEASVSQLRSVLTEDLREELSEVFLPLRGRCTHPGRVADRPGPADRLARGSIQRDPSRDHDATNGRTGPAPPDAHAPARTGRGR